jgi:uncharacterized membrane protein YkoI
MTEFATRRALLLALLLVPAGAGRARADNDDDDDDDDDDHNKASRAVQQGQARPLAELLNLVRAKLGGEVIGIKLKSKNGRQVYKLKVVTPGGLLREVSVDAITGTIVNSGDD